MPTVRISAVSGEDFDTFLSRPFVGVSVEPEPLGPGKFDQAANPALAERLHNLSVQGGVDEEAGNVDESGVWLARIGRFVLIENASGSVTYVAHPSPRAAASNFSILAGDVDGEEVDELPAPGRTVAFPPVGERLSSEAMTRLLEEIKASAVPGSCVSTYRALQGAIVELKVALAKAEERDRALVVPEGL